MKITGHRTPTMFRRYQLVEKEDVARALAQAASREKEADGSRPRKLVVLGTAHSTGHR